MLISCIHSAAKVSYDASISFESNLLISPFFLLVEKIWFA